MPPKSKLGTFGNPKAIVDVKTWSKVARKGYSNIVMDYEKGIPVVKNSENLSETVKEIQIPRLVDSYRALDLYRNKASKEEHDKYATSLQAFNKQRDDKAELNLLRIEALQQSYVELAQAIGNYRISPSFEAAKRVAIAQKTLHDKEAEAAPKGPKGEKCEPEGSCERIVKNFEYPLPPSGNISTPPVNIYYKYDSMPDTREINLMAPPPPSTTGGTAGPTGTAGLVGAAELAVELL
jgi:hypothetical protein